MVSCHTNRLRMDLAYKVLRFFLRVDVISIWMYDIKLNSKNISRFFSSRKSAAHEINPNKYIALFNSWLAGTIGQAKLSNSVILRRIHFGWWECFLCFLRTATDQPFRVRADSFIYRKISIMHLVGKCINFACFRRLTDNNNLLVNCQLFVSFPVQLVINSDERCCNIFVISENGLRTRDFHSVPLHLKRNLFSPPLNWNELLSNVRWNIRRSVLNLQSEWCSNV